MREHPSRPDADNPEWTAQETRDAKPLVDLLPHDTATALKKGSTRSRADLGEQTARFKAAIATAFIEQREGLYQRTRNTSE